MNLVIETLDSSSRPTTLGNIIRGKRRDVRVARTANAAAVLISKPLVAFEQRQDSRIIN
jgi:hypothetical protein